MADFSLGFVFETDVSASLTIEGNPVERFKRTKTGVSVRLSRARVIRADTLEELVALYVKRTGILRRRNEVTRRHLRELRKGRQNWNRWRVRNPTIHPMLAGVRLGIDFKRRRLDGYDFSYANFTGATLRGVSMTGANFHQAILAGADLTEAHLENANFCRTDLYKTNFTDARLTGANIQGVQMAKTVLSGADLRNCTVYGLSTWDLDLSTARDQNLKIKYQSHIGETSQKQGEEVVFVDGLDLAAFVYSTLNNRNIARIVEGASRRWVLILGRFTGGGQEVLDVVREHLKARHYIPVVFDFERPNRRDLIETLMVLAGLSAFVIVDMSDPRSAPLELQAIASSYGVPIFPIMRRGSDPFGMFAGLRKFPWVFAPQRYDTVAELKAKVVDRVIRQAHREVRRLTKLKWIREAD